VPTKNGKLINFLVYIISMGFFNKIFGDKKEEVIETNLELLPTIIEKDFSAREKELELVSAKKISEIKYLHSKSVKLLLDIKEKELTEKDNKRFNKAALTSKAQIEKQLEKLLEKINPTDRGNTLADVKAYAGEGHALLVNEIMAFRKNIAYTSAYLKDEMRELGETIQGMLTNFQDLNKAIEKEKEMFDFEKTKQKIKEILTMQSQIEEMTSQKEKLEKEKKEKEKEHIELAKKLSDFENGPKMQKIKELEGKKSSLGAQKQALKTEIASLLATIDRPLQRFQSLVASGRWKISKEHENVLNGFITNPMLGLKSDPGGEKFKEILQEIVKAIEDGKIDLKEKEKEKRMNALNEILTFNFFEQVFWKLNEIQKQQKEVEEGVNTNPAQKELAVLEEEVKEKEKEIEKLVDVIVLNQKKHTLLLENVEKEKEKILQFCEKALNKKIHLN
jgi:hypothetical protein